jgi:class 3 adenylate cyclase
VELAGGDHAWRIGDTEAIANEIAEFLARDRPATEPNRVLATVLFTDIVDSTSERQRWVTVAGATYYAAIMPCCLKKSTVSMVVTWRALGIGV